MEILNTLADLARTLGTLLVQLLETGVRWSPLIAWIGWWLFAVDWRKLWPTLAGGAWAPAVLLAVMVALLWASLFPSSCECLGFMSVPNFWWQLGAVGLVLSAALFSGWLQGLLGWRPFEIDLDAEPSGHDHGHAAAAH